MPSITLTGPLTKANTVHYLDCNVLEAAKRRIRRALDMYDSLVVAFSGGKDSLVVLNLVHEVYEELGVTKPVDVIFRDEEVIPDVVINFVNEYRQKPWVKMLWFCVPLKSTKYILGRTYSYVQWDPNRDKHVREKPAWGIVDDRQVFDQFTMDEYTAGYFTGKVCMGTGIRALEGLTRRQSVMTKLNDPTFAASSSRRLDLARFIYDWSENDVFKFFYERGIRYCQIYDQQVFNGENLRVATALLTENAKNMDFLKSRDPEFLDRVLAVFPEAGVQSRYYREMDFNLIFSRFEQNLDGVQQFILETITDPTMQKIALQRLDDVKAASDQDAFPINHLFRAFSSGRFKRVIQPLAASNRKRKMG